VIREKILPEVVLTPPRKSAVFFSIVAEARKVKASSPRRKKGTFLSASKNSFKKPWGSPPASRWVLKVLPPWLCRGPGENQNRWELQVFPKKKNDHQL
jgi:hypothetical protein